MHYKSFYDEKDMLYAHDLQGRDFVVTIEHVAAGEIIGEKGRKSRKPFIRFIGAKKRLAINKTNGKTIATLYGPDTTKWVGKSITLYPTTTEYNGEQLECIRVRPKVPSASAKAGGARDATSAPPVTETFNDMSADERAEIDRIEREEMSQ